MTTQSEFPNENSSPPGWLLPVIAVAIIGVAAVIGVLLTRPPTPQVATPAQPTVAPAPAAGEAEQAAIPMDHGAIDPNGPPVERIDLAGARAHFDAKTALFIDVRSGQEYTAGHIEGALSLTSPEMDARIQELPAGTVVIAYGDASKPEAAVRAAQIFMELGYPKVIAMEGGWQAWKEVGFPVGP
jgi:rhodanese-related sulfurtransferase